MTEMVTLTEDYVQVIRRVLLDSMVQQDRDITDESTRAGFNTYMFGTLWGRAQAYAREHKLPTVDGDCPTWLKQAFNLSMCDRSSIAGDKLIGRSSASFAQAIEELRLSGDIVIRWNDIVGPDGDGEICYVYSPQQRRKLLEWIKQRAA